MGWSAPSFGAMLIVGSFYVKGPLFLVHFASEFPTFFGPGGPDIRGARAH